MFNTRKVRISNIQIVTSDVVPSLDSNLIETQSILGSDITLSSRFGFATRTTKDSTRLAMGAPLNNGNRGALYIYKSTTGSVGPDNILTYDEEQKLTASDQAIGANLGNSVAINGAGDVVIGGASNVKISGSQRGAGYVYTRDGSDIWSELQKLQPSDLNTAGFGDSVTINNAGDRCAIGIPENSDVGAVYTYRSSTDASDITTWVQEQVLIANTPIDSGNFGLDLSMDYEGKRLAIGASTGEGPGSSDNGVYVFHRVSNTWTQEQLLHPTDIQLGYNFGYSVSLNSSGTILAIGARNGSSDVVPRLKSTYVFTANNNASDISTWTQQQKIFASDGISTGSERGYEVSLNSVGDKLVIGDLDKSSEAGFAAVFTSSVDASDITTWTEQQSLLPSDAYAGNQFGASLELNGYGDRVAIGSARGPTGNNLGGVQIFQTEFIQSSGTVIYDSLIDGEVFRMENTQTLKIKY